jgi:O-antigen/teichoic acid export membrane protein
MAVVMCLIVHLITETTDIVYCVYILSIALFPYSLSLVCQCICNAYERLHYTAISQLAGNVFKVFLGLFVLIEGYSLVSLMIVLLGSQFFIFFISLYFALKCTSNKQFRLNFNFCKLIIKATPVFALIIILNTIRWNIDTLILTNMMGELEVGYYNAAYRLMNAIKLSLSCYVVAIQPVIFRLFKLSLEKYSIVCKDSIKYLFVLTIPIAVGTTLLSDNFVILVFQPEFLPASHVLPIIVSILIFSGANLILSHALVASNNQKVNLQGNFISMFFNICLNLLLIPKLSYIGASISSIVSSFILLIYQYSFISRYLFKIDYFQIIKKPIISAAIMGAGILFMKDINLLLIILLSILIYVGGLLILKTFSSDDRELIKKLWKGELNVSITKV